MAKYITVILVVMFFANMLFAQEYCATPENPNTSKRLTKIINEDLPLIVV